MGSALFHDAEGNFQALLRILGPGRRRRQRPGPKKISLPLSKALWALEREERLYLCAKDRPLFLHSLKL